MSLVERVAREIGRAVLAQDDMATGQDLNPDLTIDWLDQGVTDFKVVALAALSALEKEGYVVVPVEPTGDMIAACRKCIADWKDGLSSSATDAEVYHAMLSARPPLTGEKE